VLPWVGNSKIYTVTPIAAPPPIPSTRTGERIAANPLHQYPRASQQRAGANGRQQTRQP
jgi:hypothetical protein